MGTISWTVRIFAEVGSDVSDIGWFVDGALAAYTPIYPGAELYIFDLANVGSKGDLVFTKSSTGAHQRLLTGVDVQNGSLLIVSFRKGSQYPNVDWSIGGPVEPPPPIEDEFTDLSAVFR